MCDKVSAQNLPGAARPPRAPAFVCEKVRRQLNPDTVTRDTRKRASTCDQPGYRTRPDETLARRAVASRLARWADTHRRSEPEHPNPATLHQSAPMPNCSRDQPPRAPPRVRSQHRAPRWSDRRLRGHPMERVPVLATRLSIAMAAEAAGLLAPSAASSWLTGRTCVQAVLLHCVARNWSFSSRTAGPTCPTDSSGPCAASPASSYPPCSAWDRCSC